MGRYDPKITLVANEPLVITPEDRARAMWLLRKYSSLTYIRRMASLFSSFVAGYRDFTRRTPEPVDFHRENLDYFQGYRRALDEGIDQVQRGDSRGYPSIFKGCKFRDCLRDRRTEFGLEHQEIGFRLHEPCVGLYAWADVASTMAARIERTVGAGWAFPEVIDTSWVKSPFPPHLDLEPAPFGAFVRTGDIVPTAGIWRPIDAAWGCPNYLWAGRIAPSGLRADKKYDYPEGPDGRGTGMAPPYTDYTYADEPARWQLLWEDHRYDHGKPPLAEEALFLDPSTDPPPWPPVHAPPN